jgi:uncharacterized membrane protein YvbJ
MFCPYCHRQNKEGAVFCEYCGKALPKQSSMESVNQQVLQQSANNQSAKTSKPKFRLSFNAVRAIITVVAIIVLVLIVLQIYNPGLLPWSK